MIKEFSGEYRWLSNFTQATIVFEGATYPTVENAFQAAKTNDLEQRKQFESVTPWQAKRFGRRVTLIPEWESVKLSIMESLVRQKFSQEKFKKKLLSTNGLIEEGNTWGDKFWGVSNGIGENHLGKILMKIRDELLAAENLHRKP